MKVREVLKRLEAGKLPATKLSTAMVGAFKEVQSLPDEVLCVLRFLGHLTYKCPASL